MKLELTCPECGQTFPYHGKAEKFAAQMAFYDHAQETGHVASGEELFRRSHLPKSYMMAYLGGKENGDRVKVKISSHARNKPLSTAQYFNHYGELITPEDLEE